jgi:hypothetical protein
MTVIVELLVERTTIAGETEELGENLPQRHFVPPQISDDQVRFRTPELSGAKPATNRLSYGTARFEGLIITLRLRERNATSHEGPEVEVR